MSCLRFCMVKPLCLWRAFNRNVCCTDVVPVRLWAPVVILIKISYNDATCVKALFPNIFIFPFLLFIGLYQFREVLFWVTTSLYVIEFPGVIILQIDSAKVLRVITYPRQLYNHLVMDFCPHNALQSQPSQALSVIHHRYVDLAHGEKSATARSGDWHHRHSPLGRKEDAYHILHVCIIKLKNVHVSIIRLRQVLQIL